MNIANIDSRITFWTGDTTGEFTDADRLLSINKAVDDIHIMILQAQDGDDYDDKNYTSNFPILKTALKGGQSDYSMPTEMVKEKRLSVSYDGTNFYKATPFDINESGVTVKSENFATTAPYYDLHDNSIEIYPTPENDVTAGLQIWISRQASLFTTAEVSAGTKEPGFDRQFHEMVPLKASHDWALSKTSENGNKVQGIKNEIAEYEQRLKQHYSDKQRDDGMVLMVNDENAYDSGRVSRNN